MSQKVEHRDRFIMQQIKNKFFGIYFGKQNTKISISCSMDPHLRQHLFIAIKWVGSMLIPL